jgi:hypothetical protein
VRWLKRLLGSVICLGVVAILVWGAVWRVGDPSHFKPGFRDWQGASANDCEPMAIALHALPFANRPRSFRLIGSTLASGPCRWSRYGLNPTILTVAQFKAAYKGTAKLGGIYMEHVALSRPMYSLLHSRAAVEVDHYYGGLGANGYVCHLIRRFDGWRLQECHEVWIS